MTYVAVLTPPFLMAGAVVFAVVVFLRHEMRRGRSAEGSQTQSNSSSPARQADDEDNERGAESDAVDVSATDG